MLSSFPPKRPKRLGIYEIFFILIGLASVAQILENTLEIFCLVCTS